VPKLAYGKAEGIFKTGLARLKSGLFQPPISARVFRNLMTTAVMTIKGAMMSAPSSRPVNNSILFKEPRQQRRL
jgi:hypothetical protein